jgi:hypothetical protein
LSEKEEILRKEILLAQADVARRKERERERTRVWVRLNTSQLQQFISYWVSFRPVRREGKYEIIGYEFQCICGNKIKAIGSNDVYIVRPLLAHLAEKHSIKFPCAWESAKITEEFKWFFRWWLSLCMGEAKFDNFYGFRTDHIASFSAR